MNDGLIDVSPEVSDGGPFSVWLFSGSMKNLHIGYFEDFNGANAILVCGDAERLQRLADLLRTLEDVNAEPVNLHLLPFVRVHRGVQLTANPADRETGVHRAGSVSSFTWHHSEEGWLESAEKIEAVARGGGHCYLGGHPAEGVIVVVSNGEYDHAWWEGHA